MAGEAQHLAEGVQDIVPAIVEAAAFEELSPCSALGMGLEPLTPLAKEAPSDTMFH